jgi:phosphatidylserine decarboxylase
VNFAPEGLSFIGISTLIAVVTYGVALNRRSWPLWLLAFALTLIALWVAYFFRNPERSGERGDRLVISPADGKVVMITDVDEPTFMKQRAIRVSVFMNVFDVHVNRYPVSGVIRFIERKSGRFLNAASEESSLQNEQVSVGLETTGGGRATQILVRQIAGLIARRIVTDGKEGDQVRQGDRMGLIRFGSRVDVFLPAGSTVRVKVGDLAQSGVTVIGEIATQ